MDQDERREFIRETRERNKRKLEESRAAAVERELSARLPDPLDAWRVDAEERERQRAAAKAELANDRERKLAREREHIAEIEGIVRAAVLAERAFLGEVLAGVLAEAIGKLDREIAEKRRMLIEDIGQIKRNLGELKSALVETIDRERGKVVDLPNPLRRVN